MAQINRIGGRASNMRQMLLSAGIGEFNAQMSIPYMMFLPRTCDPYAQGVIQLIEGLQNLLNGRGEHLELTGTLTVPTMRALEKYAGKAWADKTWVQLYGDVLAGKRAPGFHQDHPPAASRSPTDGYVEETGLGNPLELASELIASPLAWLAAGGLAFYLFRQRSRRF